ncbi:MAG: PHP domain-containing protein [Clostridiales bacterium]|nr:PHP domain-containing protein [Clostridiales bacterium]
MIYYDFHIHSALSPCGDNDMTPNNIVNMAALSGLDAVAISDHNSAGNVRAAMAAGKKAGVTVLPAMEVETEEEVHILTLYPSADAAEAVAREVYNALPDIKNRPEIFGEQLIMDEEDNIVGTEEKLLISPAALSINRLFDMVKEAGGLFIPAHVDRHSYSVLTNLGFIPDDIDIRCIEVSRNTADLAAYIDSRPELAKYKVLRNSDAHYLGDIAQRDAFLEAGGIRDIFRILGG